MVTVTGFLQQAGAHHDFSGAAYPSSFRYSIERFSGHRTRVSAIEAELHRPLPDTQAPAGPIFRAHNDTTARKRVVQIHRGIGRDQRSARVARSGQAVEIIQLVLEEQ
jgi:hypothetical protein